MQPIAVSSGDNVLQLREFDVEAIHDFLQLGQPVIPLWLDRIHQELGNNLHKLQRFQQERPQIVSEPEAVTRKQRIDKALTALGWTIISYEDNLDSNLLTHHAVAEYPVATGFADYALFVNGLFLGAIEAKKLSVGSQAALEQAKRYSKGVFDGVGNWRGYRVPFLFSSNGELVYFLDIREPSNLTRQITNFHTPSALAEFYKRNDRDSYHWLETQPIAANTRLRSYQQEAIAATETAIMQGKRQLLLAMATGTGKTFTIVSLIYRLLASKTVKRVLFLVDRRALAAQAVTAFGAFDTPRGNKFDREYEVYSQAFKREDFEEDTKFNSQVLPNSYLTEPNENHTFVYVATIQRMKLNLFGNSAIETNEDGDVEDETDAEQLDIPIHTFDLIIADECHRGYTASENGSWRKTIEYFDAIKIGLTATPALHTVSLFKEIVYRYTTEQAIEEGYLVDYEQININSDVRINGTFLREGELVATIDVDTGARYYEHLEDEREFNSTDLERKITVPDSNRKIILEIAKYAQQHESSTGRFPKILIFASNDLPHISHADNLVTICKEVFARGDDFVKKITGKVDRPLQKIPEFRNRPEPGIVVTVDLLTTGVDIPAIEFIVFLRPVKSRILWVQMLGRGTRRCDDIGKTHFKIFDCFGGSLVEYFADSTDFKIEPPTQQTVPVQKVIDKIINNVDRDSLSQRLATDLGNTLNLLRDRGFQDLLDNYPRAKTTFWVAEEVEDIVTSEVVIQGQKAEDYLDSFYRLIRSHGEQIQALQILRQRPQGWNAAALEELRQQLIENRFTEANLQRAYQLVHHKALADLISLIKCAYNPTEPAYTAQERVDKAIATVTQGQDFTPEQLKWLGYIREHLIQNLSIDLDDFEYAPIFERYGGKGKAKKVFEGNLETLIHNLNSAIAA
jgi:type I restriction enzyme R subunit